MSSKKRKNPALESLRSKLKSQQSHSSSAPKPNSQKSPAQSKTSAKLKSAPRAIISKLKSPMSPKGNDYFISLPEPPTPDSSIPNLQPAKPTPESQSKILSPSKLASNPQPKISSSSKIASESKMTKISTPEKLASESNSTKISSPTTSKTRARGIRTQLFSKNTKRAPKLGAKSKAPVKTGGRTGVLRKKIASSSSRIALVCDWLTLPGGAEKVLLELHHMYPSAPIYTSQYRPKKIDWFSDADVRTGWLNLFPASLRKVLGPLRQLYFSHLDLSSYDLVISVTGAEAKAVRTAPKPKKFKNLLSKPKKSPNEFQNTKRNDPISPLYHTSSEKSIDTPEKQPATPEKSGAFHISYCHVPTQYYWRLYDKYLENPGFGLLNPLARLALCLLVKPLRKADYTSAQQVDQFVTISTYASSLIKEYYNRESLVIAPPVEIAQFSTDFSTGLPISGSKSSPNSSHSIKSQEIQTSSPELTSESLTSASESTPNPQNSPYIIACRQAPWKRIDLAISACQQLGRPLIVIGDGAEHKNLVKLATSEKFKKSSLDKNYKAQNPLSENPKSAQPPQESNPIPSLYHTSSEKSTLTSTRPEITFLPWLSSRELVPYLQSARAYIFPSLEPFGIAAVEALAAGCPVIAYAEGGSRDIVEPGKNGVLFPEQTPDSLVSAIRDFESQTFSRSLVSDSADRFSAEYFRAKIKFLVDRTLSEVSKKPNSSNPS